MAEGSSLTRPSVGRNLLSSWNLLSYFGCQLLSSVKCLSSQSLQSPDFPLKLHIRDENLTKFTDLQTVLGEGWKIGRYFQKYCWASWTRELGGRQSCMDTKEVLRNICTIATVKTAKAQTSYLCKIEDGCSRCDLQQVVPSLTTADLQRCSPILHPEKEETNKNSVPVELMHVALPNVSIILHSHRFPSVLY